MKMVKLCTKCNMNRKIEWHEARLSHRIAKVITEHVSKNCSVFNVKNETESLCHVVTVAMVTISIDKRLRV